MQTNSLHTAFVHSTTHAISRTATTHREHTPDVRHAALVVSRMIRSTDHRDQEVRKRLGRAATILKTNRSATEPPVPPRTRDVVFQLADRLIRCVHS